MASPATIAAFRYGYGPAAGAGPNGTTPTVLLRELRRQSRAAEAAPDDWPSRSALHTELRIARRERREGVDGAEPRNFAINTALRRMQRADQRAAITRALESRDGFDRRLVAFWADHFTVVRSNQVNTLQLPHLRENAIAPHVTGRFADMLRAVTLHPAMLVYLDQTASFGPLSPAGLDQGRGLNENLAREILELHTLGVDAAYSQKDVREFAELLTGLSHGPKGFVFRQRRAEPGSETVLGTHYGTGEADLAPILEALDDLAAHPATARHLARKLLVHFLGSPAPEDLVDDMAAAYLAKDTRLDAFYEVMLSDPRAWTPTFSKARTPFEFIVAALRAGGVTGAEIATLSGREVNTYFLRPLAEMGQPLWQANGPDGWPETPETWITPVGLAARLRWSQAFVERALSGTDPRDFLETAIGDAASGTLRFAVSGAEQRSEGLVLVLASPEFNRR